MSKTVKQILNLCKESSIVIVSYGLAPNPFGFCFERDEDTTLEECKEMHDLLSQLTSAEEKEIRKEVFG